MNNMLTKNMRLRPLALAVYCIMILVVALLSMVIFTVGNENIFLRRGEFFWPHLLWFEFLLTFVWFDGFVMPFTAMLNHRKTIGSGYILFSRNVFMTVVISLAIFIVSVRLPDSGILKTLSIGLQIIVMACYLISALMITSAQRMQQDAVEDFPDNVPDPTKLAILLESCKSSPKVSRGNAAMIKNLQDKLRYSLPSCGKITSLDEYHQLVSMVEILSQKARTGNDDELKELSSSLNELIDRIKANCRS